MTNTNNNSIIQDKTLLFSEAGFCLDSKQLQKFAHYYELLIEYNQKFNLTAITDEFEVYQKHFVDSLFLMKHIFAGQKIIDIGTGAGFPGVPLAIMLENTEFLLMDSLNKRIGFLNSVIEALQLKNASAVHMRAEEAGCSAQYRDRFDAATSRAVTKLNVLTEYSAPLVKKGGYVLAMKGRNFEVEINISKLLQNLGLDEPDVEKYTLPSSDIIHTVVRLKKVSETPQKYPRRGKRLGTE